jgi:hypothetical protein
MHNGSYLPYLRIAGDEHGSQISRSPSLPDRLAFPNLPPNQLTPRIGYPAA